MINRTGISSINRLSKSNRKSNYREYYNNKTADLVEQAFKQDIMEFNYEF